MVEASASVPELRALLHVEQRKLAAVRELGRSLGARLDLEHVLETVLQKVPELLDVERATLYLVQRGPAGPELVSKIVLGGLGPSAGGAHDGQPAVQEIRMPLGSGVAGAVAQSGQPLNIPDAYADPRFNAAVDRRTGFRTRSILCVPVPDHEGRISGVLQALNRRDGHPFDGDDEALLGAVAAYAGIALENAQLYQSQVQQNTELLRTQADLRRRIAELDLLYQVEREASAAQELNDLLASLSRRAAQLLSGEVGVVALRLPSGDLELTFFHHDGPPLGQPPGPGSAASQPGAARAPAPDIHRAVLPHQADVHRNGHGQGLITWVVQHDQPLCISDAASDPRSSGRLLGILGLDVRQAIIIPLRHPDAAADYDDSRGGALGAIAVMNKVPAPDRPAVFDAADERLLTLLAGHAARAIVLSRTRSLRTRESHLSAIGRMLAGIMHDVRAPMTIISGYAQLMADSDDRAERERYADRVRKQLALMESMTGEVMAFARGDRRLLSRRVLMNQFLAEVHEQLASELLRQPRPVELQIEARYTGVAYFDELKLLRVVHNLARNAAQAMPDGGRFRIEVDADPDRDELVLTFSDTGSGIPDEVQGHLFETFVSAGKDGGTGLGLAIVKKIVEDHRGRVSVSTRRGEGTTFTVVLPLSRPPEQASLARSEAERGSSTSASNDPLSWKGPS